MNQELLRKLQLQAGGSFYPEVNPQTQAIFAKLIVQECAGLVKDDDNAYDILKHFGVER